MKKLIYFNTFFLLLLWIKARRDRKNHGDRINSHDEIIVTANHKILIFDKIGNNLKEIRIKLGTSFGTIV